MIVKRGCVEHRVVSSMAAITQPLDAESPMMEMFINVKLETIDDAGVSKHCGGGCEGHEMSSPLELHTVRCQAG